MSVLIGVVLALMSAALAALIKLDRRTFYATMVIVVAHYYVLFALMGGSTRTVMLESLVMTAFLVLAVAGFRRNPWIIVVALFAHGLFDLGHGLIISNPGVPSWWPPFCMAFDVVAAGALAWLTSSFRPLSGGVACEPQRTP